MARIRSVKPEFWADEDLADVTRDARLLYIGLWNLSDEHSRLRGDPRYIKGQLFPYDDDMPATAVDECIKALEAAGKVVRYRVGAGQYLFLPNLGKHQRLESDKVPSKLPPPPDPSESAQVSAHATVNPDPRADLSARDADESAPGTEDHALLYVAGSMEHGAWSMDTAARGAQADAVRDDDADFDRFWSAYPRRIKMLDARAAWTEAIKKASPDVLVAAAARYAEQERDTEAKFVAQPATWLDKERWTDEPSPRKPPRSQGSNDWDGPYLNPADPNAYAGYRPHNAELEAENARFEAEAAGHDLP